MQSFAVWSLCFSIAVEISDPVHLNVKTNTFSLFRIKTYTFEAFHKLFMYNLTFYAWKVVVSGLNETIL